MKVRKIPLRTCCVTGEKLDKRELLRIVRTKDGKIIVDETGKLNGHGAYIKKELNVLELAKKKKTLERKLDAQISEEIYEEIKEIIEK